MNAQLNDTLIASEDAVLALLIANPEALADIDIVPADMHTEYGKAIMAALIRLNTAGKPVSGISLAHELRSAGELDRIGGLEQIKAIRKDDHHISELPRFVEIIRDAAMLSRMRTISSSVASLAANEALPMAERYKQACEIVNRMESVREAYKPIHIKDGVLLGLKDVADRIDLANTGHIPGMRSSLKELDNVLLGIRPGTVVTIAGRTSMGKTVLAMQIAKKACTTQSKVLVFSLEMTAGELMQRQCAAMGDINLAAISGGTMTGKEMAAFTDMSAIILQWNMWVDDRGGIDVREIGNVARRQAARSGLDLIVVDHIGLMTHPGDNLAQGIGKTTSALKALAKELKVPVIMVAQLNREAAKGATIRRPTLVDLQDSGRIEQDSDVVLLIHRPGYYDESAPQDYAEIIVAKNRQGARGVVVKAQWEGMFTRFTNWPDGRDYQKGYKERFEP